MREKSPLGPAQSHCTLARRQVSIKMCTIRWHNKAYPFDIDWKEGRNEATNHESSVTINGDFNVAGSEKNSDKRVERKWKKSLMFYRTFEKSHWEHTPPRYRITQLNLNCRPFAIIIKIIRLIWWIVVRLILWNLNVIQEAKQIFIWRRRNSLSSVWQKQRNKNVKSKFEQ